MGCGKGSTPSGDTQGPTHESSGNDLVPALEELEATIERDDQGEIVGVGLIGPQIPDAGIDDLQKTLPNCEIHR